eukprot:Lankesteria_metandrocarpae@DN4939_c0_g1_i2.p1
MAVIAHKCPDLQVYLFDLSKERIDAWNSDQLPIYEPGLDALVKTCRGRNLFFTTDEAVIDTCGMIFLAVNTPTKTFGVGKGSAADLTFLEKAVRMIARNSTSSKIIVEKSTVPVRTADSLRAVLLANAHADVNFTILSNPEFLAEGSAVMDLLDPDRVLVGGGTESALESSALDALVSVYARWVPRDRILTTNLWSSELSKLIANAFLAQRISSINAVSALCEKSGADVRQVATTIGRDSRIGAKFLNASIGFGGSCFQKDILNLIYICEYYKLPEVAEYWRGVIRMNNFQKNRFTESIIDGLFSTVRGKKICVLGFAYKKNTGDTRQTPASDVCEGLMNEGAILSVYDPKVSYEAALRELAAHGTTKRCDVDKLFSFASSVEEGCTGAHAVVILTEWEEFREVDYANIFSIMEKPAFVFDGRNILDLNMLASIGFQASGVGVPLPPRRA